MEGKRKILLPSVELGRTGPALGDPVSHVGLTLQLLTWLLQQRDGLLAVPNWEVDASAWGEKQEGSFFTDS